MRADRHSTLRERARLLAGAALALLTAFAAVLAVEPANAAKDDSPPKLDARAWILVDARDGDVLAADSPGRSLPIASATKLMTAYLALRDLDLDKMVEAPGYDANPVESVLGLREGEEISVRDLLVAMMLPSANDAASALADAVSGSVPRFVKRMNGAAAKLGLDDTSYANPIGLDDPLNVSSARDLAALTLVLREDERFRKIVSKPDATLKTGAQRRQVSTRNTLLLGDGSVDGVKTGHTRGAGYVLVASAERKGVPLVSVVLGADSEGARDAESARLLDYGFSLYGPRRAVRRGEVVGTVAVSGEEDPLELEAATGERVRAREDQSVQYELVAPAEVEAPVGAGERIGRAVITLDGERAGAVSAVAAEVVAAPGLLESLGGPAGAILIVVGLILIVAAFALGVRRRSEPEEPESERSPEERELSQSRRRRERERQRSRT
ncbi:MAG TPA: D-alanyl-D-alanine carboxypeptidase family protein [Solirubrobacterales bacterium]|nr:D-alanyl-D-alanine carboxypeptidase family protein [Solirubrobacterales bacterium]